MSWIKSILKNILIVGIITSVLFFGVDFFLGNKFISYFNLDHAKIEKSYRIEDPVFHHTLLPDYDGVGFWGNQKYKICTNHLGFKDRCDKAQQITEKVDIAFIGDSFTEGIGLPYEDTFVGQIAKARPNLRIVNLGVSSYAPSIYLAKIKKLLDDGFTFKELVVYIDISDIQDEAVSYLYKDGVVQEPESVKNNRIALDASETSSRKFLKQSLPITYIFISRIKAINDQANAKDYLERDFSRSAWTYNPNSPGYGSAGVDASIMKSVDLMNELYKLLSRRGIKLSVGVYPWPSQLLYDNEDSRQVKVWRDFCATRCSNFYNLFPVFFAKEKDMGARKVLSEYFINGDVHYNAEGAKLIADNFLDSYNKK